MPPARGADNLWHSEVARLVPSGGRFKLLYRIASSKREQTLWLTTKSSADDVLRKVAVARADADAIIAAIRYVCGFSIPFHQHAADALIADAYRMHVHVVSRLRSSAPASDNRSEVEQPLCGGVQAGLFDSIREPTMGVDTTVTRKRTQPDYYVPSENIRNQATGSMRRVDRRVDRCQNPQCVTERRERAAELVEKAELQQQLARLRAGLREVTDELAAGDGKLGLAAQSFQVALMEILDSVGEDDADDDADVEAAADQPAAAVAAGAEGRGGDDGEQQQQGGAAAGAAVGAPTPTADAESSCREEEDEHEVPPVPPPEPLQLEHPAGRLAILDAALVVLDADGSEVSQASMWVAVAVT